jgi:biopolymer transport protein ExbB/TolQ
MFSSKFLTDTMHTVTHGLQIPTIIVLLLLTVITLVILGSIIVEFFTERKALKANIPALMASVNGKSMPEISGLIQKSEILKRQKKALLELIKYSYLPDEELEAIAKKLLAQTEDRFNKIVGYTDLIARVAPMFGLMGTLIPLGPGLIALGQGDTKTLADSLLIAFDTTILGLVCAAVSYIISKIRNRWYEDYMVSLEGIMECILEEAKNNG